MSFGLPPETASQLRRQGITKLENRKAEKISTSRCPRFLVPLPVDASLVKIGAVSGYRPRADHLIVVCIVYKVWLSAVADLVSRRLPFTGRGGAVGGAGAGGDGRESD